MKNSFVKLFSVIFGSILIFGTSMYAQSWSTSGDTISSSGYVKATNLTVIGSNVLMKGLVTDTTTDLLEITKQGNIQSANRLAFNSFIYPPSSTLAPCDTTKPLWYSQSIFGSGSLVTKTCTSVGIGEAGIANFPDAPLSVSNGFSNVQFSIVNPTSLTDVFTVDKSGNTVISRNASISGLAGIGVAPSSLTTLNIAGKSGYYTTLISTADTSNIYNIMSEFTTTNSASKIGLAVHIAAGSQNYDVFDVYGNGQGYFAGNVLIQTTNNEYALNVGGTIWSNEVQVCMSGCDFVFDKNYKLMPLKDIQQYLQINHHLPGIPSAKEMESANGVPLGKMDSQLLQKVEELTLYLLQQQQKMDEQQKEIDELKQVIITLQKKGNN